MTSFRKNQFSTLQDISKMKQIITLIFILFCLTVNAQLKQKLADHHYAYEEYAKCVQMYDELASDCFKSKKNADWENVRKAAVVNFHLFNMNEAIGYFEKLQTKNMLTEKDREYFLQALRYDGRYGKAEQLARESSNFHSNNSYFARLSTSTAKIDDFHRDSALLRIREAKINSGKGDFGPAYFNNSLVFASKASNAGFVNPDYGYDGDYYLNIMQSTFGSDSVLNDPKMMKHQFLSRAHDGPVSFNSDGTEMVITRNKIGKKYGKEFVVLALYFSKFENGEWSELKPFEFNNDTYNVGHGVFDENGNKLYFTCDKPGGLGGSDIYVSSKLGASWSEPVNLGSTINTEMDEMFPFVQNDKIYFASKGHVGLGGLDIFESNLDGSDLRNMGAPVNSSHDDFALIFNASGEIGFFSSNRKDNIDHLYHVKRRIFNIDLEGIVFEKYATLEPCANQTVWIKNMTDQSEIEVTTNAQGEFNSKLALNNDYRVYTKKDEFILLGEVSLSTKNLRRDSTFKAELVLKPTTIQIHLRVVEKATGKVIPEAITTVTDYNLGWDTTMMTNTLGIVTLTVDRNKVFWAHGAKKGFIDADISFNSSNENDKVIDIELALPLIKKGEKFKLENIFYDLNKSTLRPESKSSLDKLADFIVKNNLKIELSAHTDCRGSDSYNQKLSQARAQSCVDYLIEKGVKKANIKAKGYGETRLVNKCDDGVDCSEEEHQENRRTEVQILEVN